MSALQVLKELREKAFPVYGSDAIVGPSHFRIVLSVKELIAIEALLETGGWIPVTERLPKIGDPKYDGEDCDGTQVLFLHDGSIYSGWPIRGDVNNGWEMSECGLGVFYGVTHWQRLLPLPKGKP